MSAILVRNLSKSFVSHTNKHEIIRALQGISLDVKEGEILGILGPNGAGKTTFLNILSTLLLPDSGSVEISGIPLIPKNFHYVRRFLNMSSGYPNYPWSLTVAENLRFYGKLYGLSASELTKKIDELIEMFELKSFANRRFDELSSGTKQRLSLAKALINDPKIIFLDEPTVGLDPDVAIKMREIILNTLKKRDITILLTTHNMDEAEEMCDRIVFIKQGQIIKLATPQELKTAHKKDDLEEVFIELAHQKTQSVNVGEGPIRQLPVTSHEALKIIAKGPLPQRIRNWFNRCLAFCYRNFLFAIRNVFAFAELLFWPIVSLISIGLLGNFLEVQENALAFILTGAITAGVLQVTQLDVAYSLLYEVWSKSMKHTMLTPIGVSEHLFGSWAIGIVRGLIIFVVLGCSAIFLFGFKFPSLMVTTIFLIGVFGSAFLLGLIVSFLILIFGQKAEITAWMLAYVVMLLGGIYYPIKTLSPFFYHLATLIPITYFLEYFRTSFGFEPVLEHSLLKGFGLLGIYLFVGLSMMEFAFYKARQKGIIVRLSE